MKLLSRLSSVVVALWLNLSSLLHVFPAKFNMTNAATVTDRL